MGGHVSKKTELAKVSVGTTKVTITNRSDGPIQVRVFRRTSTNDGGANAVETLKCEYNLSPGEEASGDNDYDITNQEKIDANRGMDYLVRVYPEGNVEAWNPEEFQIVFDGTYTSWPDVKLTAHSSRRDMPGGYPAAASAASAPACGTGLEAKIKALSSEMREIKELLQAAGVAGSSNSSSAKLSALLERFEKQKLEVIAELQAADDGGDISFYDAFSEAGGEASQDIVLDDIAEDCTHKTFLVSEPKEWWNEASLTSLELAPTTRLCDTQIFQRESKYWAPWSEGKSGQLYQEMGMRDPGKSYVAVWMLLGNAAILTVSEVVNQDLLDQAFKDGEQACLSQRFKLVMDPIEVHESCRSILPATATKPESADFVKRFLGEKGSKIHRAKTVGGIDYVSLMIDFNCAGMLILWALKNVGFREGHVLDLHVVDWPGAALFASGRLKITKEVSKMVRS